MATYSPIPLHGQNNSVELVNDQMDRLNKLADNLIKQTALALSNLGATAISTVELDPRFQWEDADLQRLLDQLGDLPAAQFDEDWLDNVNLGNGNDDFTFDPGLLSQLSQALPKYVMPPAPTFPAMPEEPADPGEPGHVAEPTAPTLPSYTAPSVDVGEAMPEFADFTAGVPFPTLREITLPPVPQLVLDSIQFEGVRPVFDIDVPDLTDYQFTAGSYSPLMLDTLKEAILKVLQGGTGLPAEFEDAIFEQAREREAELGARDVDQARDEYAARNHKYPPGALSKRIDRARTNASNKVSELNREQFITRWRLEVEQFRAVIATAVGLEEMWVGAFNASERLRFEAAQMQLNFALQIFNAQITKINAQAQLYQVDGELYKTRIQAEVAKVQAYAEQLRGQQLIGELNAQDVKIYEAKLNALVINAELYKARVEGYVAKFRSIEVQVALYRAQLESNSTLAGIYESEVRAFGGKIEAQKNRDERFATKARIFSIKTDAKKTEYDALSTAYGNHFKLAELERDTFIANSARVREFISAESGRINALATKYQAFASEIGAKADVEKARYTLMLSYAQAQIERMKASADILLKNGEINIQSALQATNLMVRARETAATTLAQLAAGLTSAASVSAGMSTSYGESLGYGYRGELEMN